MYASMSKIWLYDVKVWRNILSKLEGPRSNCFLRRSLYNLMTGSINDNIVYRTARDTPGQLKVALKFSFGDFS